MPESGLAAYLDHFWSSAVFNWCRAMYVLRWKWPPNLPYCFFASYWEYNYTREWTRSLIRPFLGHGGRLPFSTGVLQFAYCGRNGRQTFHIAFLQAIWSLSIPESGLGP